MGVFDEINGEQVKCFYIPYYCHNSVIHSGGLCNHYYDGSDVPWATLYYNYTDNFIIHDMYDGLIHIIKDGKVLETVKVEDVTEEHCLGINKLITYSGWEYKITSYEEFNRYLKNIDEYNKKRDNWQKRREEIERLLSDVNLSQEDKETYRNEDAKILEEAHKEYRELNSEFDVAEDKESLLGELVHIYYVNMKYGCDESEEKERIEIRKKIIEHTVKFDDYINWLATDELRDEAKEVYKNINSEN